jgi:hypothetical protein
MEFIVAMSDGKKYKIQAENDNDAMDKVDAVAKSNNLTCNSITNTEDGTVMMFGANVGSLFKTND